MKYFTHFSKNRFTLVELWKAVSSLDGDVVVLQPPPRPPQYLHSCRTPAPRPQLRKYSQLDAGQTAGSSQLAISLQILCKLQRPRHGSGRPAVSDNSYLRTRIIITIIMMITCYHAQLCCL